MKKKLGIDAREKRTKEKYIETLRKKKQLNCLYPKEEDTFIRGMGAKMIRQEWTNPEKPDNSNNMGGEEKEKKLGKKLCIASKMYKEVEIKEKKCGGVRKWNWVTQKQEMIDLSDPQRSESWVERRDKDKI